MAGLFAKLREGRSKATSTWREGVQKCCPVPSEKQAGWLGAPLQQKLQCLIKRPWATQIVLKYRHIAPLLPCLSANYSFTSELVTSSHSSQLLNETLKGKAVQMPTLSDMWAPQAEPRGLSPNRVLPSGMLQWRMHLGRGAKASRLFQHPARVWEKEGMRVIQKTISFQKRKATDQSLFLLLCPLHEKICL